MGNIIPIARFYFVSIAFLNILFFYYFFFIKKFQNGAIKSNLITAFGLKSNTNSNYLSGLASIINDGSNTIYYENLD